MTHDDLQTLVDFHYWALDRTLAAVESLTPDQFTRDVGSSFPSVRDTLAHLQGAEMIWLGRLRGRAPSAFPRPERFGSMADVRTAWAETEADLRGVIAGLDDASLSRVVEYRLLNGKPAATRTDHIIQHLVNHATYHRGQLTTMLRQLGGPSPAQTDLHVFYRERVSGS